MTEVHAPGLEGMWERQRRFTAGYFRAVDKPLEELSERDLTEWTKEYLLALHSELTEVLNTVPWKRHRQVTAEPRQRLLEELVDVQKFLWGLMVIHGVTLEELEREFHTKSTVVEERLPWEKSAIKEKLPR